jgi:sugar phosphate isomerase/epimerase
MPKIGIQLYTLRQEAERDIRKVLRESASIGFSGVEFAFNYGGLGPDELAAVLRKENLDCAGVFIEMKQAASQKSDAYMYAEAMNCPYIVSGLPGMMSGGNLPAAVKKLSSVSASAEAKGMRFLYHNHWQELETIAGKSALDILFEETSAGGVCFELDTGWLYKAGCDPVEYIKKYAGRLPCLHLRDYHPDFEASVIGEGKVDIRSAARAAVEAGVEWLILEQSKGTFESVKANYVKLAGLIRGL